MKAILEFNLPEDQHEYNLVNKAVDMSVVLHEFDQYLRGILKYEENITDDAYNALQDARDKLWEMAKDGGIEL
jgi:hypothetical protein